MMKKKILCMGLCLMLLVLFGCSKEEKNKDQKENNTTQTKTTEATTENKTEATTADVTTEEAKKEFVKDMLLSNKFYMPGIQSYHVDEYIFYEDGTVTEGNCNYDPANLIVNSTYTYTIDEDNLTVTIDFNGFPRVYEYAETLGGFISNYDDGGEPMAPPSCYEFALIPLDHLPTNEEIMKIYQNYMEYYEGPIETTTEATTEATSSTSEAPYVRYSEQTLSWNDVDSFVMEGTEFSILVMVTDGEGGTMYSFNSLENPEAHVVFTMRPTDISNNVLVGGLNIIDANADMVYLGLYEENGVKYIDMYDVETQQHSYYKENNS